MRIDSYNQIAQIYNAQSAARPQKTQSSYSVSDQISISQDCSVSSFRRQGGQGRFA